MKKRVVVALGGNAMSTGNKMDYEFQLENIKKTAGLLADLIEEGYELIVSHGNGPQVGNLLLQNDLSKEEVPAMPLDVLTSQTQGFIGYMIEQSLENEFIKRGINKPVITVSTRVEVSREDKAFERPTKPVGRFYSREESQTLEQEKGYSMVEDANRGYRRVVFSPKPKRILERDMIKILTERGSVVIAAGGGGIPVLKKEDGTYEGIEAVIDKDLTSAKLAEELGADIFMILTDVENVYINYGKEDQEALREVRVSDLNRYIENGEFSEGSMLPKIQGAVEFAKKGGVSYITSLDRLVESLRGETGTKISLN